MNGQRGGGTRPFPRACGAEFGDGAAGQGQQTERQYGAIGRHGARMEAGTLRVGEGGAKAG